MDVSPGEIFQHGINLLENDSDTNRRLRILGIDNAHERMIKTYQGCARWRARRKRSDLGWQSAEHYGQAEQHPGAGVFQLHHRAHFQRSAPERQSLQRVGRLGETNVAGRN
jgi:hypothetical protein